MRYERVGMSLVGAIGTIALVLATAMIWLFLTNPVGVTTDLSEGDVSPLIRDPATVLMQALQGLLKYL